MGNKTQCRSESLRNPVRITTTTRSYGYYRFPRHHAGTCDVKERPLVSLARICR